MSSIAVSGEKCPVCGCVASIQHIVWTEDMHKMYQYQCCGTKSCNITGKPAPTPRRAFKNLREYQAEVAAL